MVCSERFVGLQLTAEYSLSVKNELRMVFSGTTDKATPLNICNHAYWNLSGDFKRDIKGHVRVSCRFIVLIAVVIAFDAIGTPPGLPILSANGLWTGQWDIRKGLCTSITFIVFVLQIPTGEVASVKGSPFDFTTPLPLGARFVCYGCSFIAFTECLFCPSQSDGSGWWWTTRL
jgi:Aldose 1-epimerase